MEDHGANCTCGNHSAAVQGLLEVRFQKSICAAAIAGDIQRVTKILEKDPNAIYSDGVGSHTGYTPLHYAARACHPAVVQVLLDFGKNILPGKPECFGLREIGIPSNSTIHDVIFAGSDPNRQTTAGKATPLHRAAFQGDIQIVKLLLDAGARPDIKDSDGQTAFHKAIQEGHEDVAVVLRERCPGLDDVDAMV